MMIRWREECEVKNGADNRQREEDLKRENRGSAEEEISLLLHGDGLLFIDGVNIQNCLKE